MFLFNMVKHLVESAEWKQIDVFILTSDRVHGREIYV